jgi:hypothetical protein
MGGRGGRAPDVKMVASPQDIYIHKPYKLAIQYQNMVPPLQVQSSARSLSTISPLHFVQYMSILYDSICRLYSCFVRIS